MASTTLPNLPPAITLPATALVWVNVGGVDYRTTVGAIAAQASPSVIPVLVTASGESLFARGMFSVETSLFTGFGTLPQLATVPLASPIWVQDISNNAGTNNYTVNAYAGDQISVDGVLGASATLNVSSTILLFLAGPTSWTLLRFGY